MKNKFSLVYYTVDQRLILEYLIDEGKRAGSMELPKDIPFNEILRHAQMYASLHSAAFNVIVVAPSYNLEQRTIVEHSDNDEPTAAQENPSLGGPMRD